MPCPTRVFRPCAYADDVHCEAGLPFSHRSLDNWITLSGTFLTAEVAGTAVIRAWVDGNYTGTFYVADVRLVKLNGALVSVIRTKHADINVSSADGATQYTLGVDYAVTNPARPNVAGAQNLVAVFDAGDSYKVARLSNGSIKPGERARVSFDMLGGLVGQIGDGSHVNCFAEPMWQQNMNNAVAYTTQRFNATKIFFGFDELHGINRDSRSRRTGRSNSETLVISLTWAGLVARFPRRVQTRCNPAIR